MQLTGRTSQQMPACWSEKPFNRTVIADVAEQQPWTECERHPLNGRSRIAGPRLPRASGCFELSPFGIENHFIASTPSSQHQQPNIFSQRQTILYLFRCPRDPP